MVRARLLLTAAFFAPVLMGAMPAVNVSASDDCNSQSFYAGGCVSATNNGDNVQLSGTSGSSTSGSGSHHGGSGSGADEAPNGDVSTLSQCIPKFDYCIYIDNQTPAAPPGATGTAPEAVTLADLATFRPVAPGRAMEPGGWAVEGLDANFVAVAPTQTIGGTLLGRPASVRFAPVAYRWSYGDGTSSRLFTPGASWAALRLPEFSRTATSHVFARTGQFTVQLIVEYSATYQWAGSAGWTPVDGTLGIPAAPIPVRVGDAATVLVGSDCSVNPSGPGC